MGVPLGHVGEDDLVAGLEAGEDFDGADGGASEFDGDSHCAAAAVCEFEEAKLTVGIGLDGAANVEDVFQARDFDGAVHA